MTRKAKLPSYIPNKVKNTKIPACLLMLLIIFGTFAVFSSTLSITGIVQGALVLTYPTDRWQRLWSTTNGISLGETPDETNIQFDNNWGSGVIAYGLSDNIQFSSSRTINMPTTGTYTFKVGSDDGTKLWIDDTLVLDKWIPRGYFEDTIYVTLTAGNHRFRLDFYENTQSAKATFSYTSPTTGLTYPTDRWQRLWSTTNGISLGETPDETNIQFDNNWGSGVIAYGLSDNIQFSSSRTINMPTTGTYTFKVGSDDGTKLWIDDTLVLDKWIPRGYFEDTIYVTLTAGNHRFRLDFYENTQSAKATFSYTSPTTGLTYPTDRWQRLWSTTNGISLGETPDETNIQFDNNWGSGVIAYGLSDNIQFSSSRTINMPTTGTYTFKVGSDDGTKLWIDDTLVLDKWIPRGYFEDTIYVTLTAGNHRFRLDFYENTQSAKASFSYTSPTTGLTYPTDRWQRLWSTTNGISLGETPDETNIQFDNNWGSGVIAYGLSDNIQFSSSRTINMPTTGTYTFKVGSDDGTKLWIDDTLVLDKWIPRGYFEDTIYVTLTAGNHRFRLDFYENTQSAKASFSYTSPTTGLTYPTDRWQRLWSTTNGISLGETPDETNIQFDNNWGSGVIAYGLSDNIQFSSSRTINMPTTGTYTFKVGSDDGTKLWIDDTLVLDKWIPRGYFEDTIYVTLTAGNHRFRLDFYENTQSAKASFSYTSPTTVLTYPTSTAFKTGLAAWGLSGRLPNSYIQFMAKFDLVSTDYRITNIAELKALNPDIIVLGYRDMMLMQDNLPDWSTVNANENWFYHYANGARVVFYNVGGQGFNNYVMDPSSVGWRNYFASYTKQAIINAGMDGLLIDDVWTDWANPDIYGLIVPSWSSVHPENPNYHTVCKNFLSYVKSQFGGLLVVSNGPDNYDYPMTVDGKVGENFLTMFDAAIDINALSTLSTANKYYVAFGRKSDQNSMMYCLSGFLLAVNGPNAYFSQGDFFDSAHPSGFGGWYPEFETLQKIGQAIGSRYFSQNVYIRDFSNGKVLFNPTANSYTVSLETNYIDPTTNQQLTKIQIPAWSGRIITRQ